MADVEKGKKHEEPEEYVPADYVAPADADEQVKGGRWSPVCDRRLRIPRRRAQGHPGLNGIPPNAPRASLLWSALRLVHIPLPAKDNIIAYRQYA